MSFRVSFHWHWWWQMNCWEEGNINKVNTIGTEGGASGIDSSEVNHESNSRHSTVMVTVGGTGTLKMDNNKR